MAIVSGVRVMKVVAEARREKLSRRSRAGKKDKAQCRKEGPLVTIISTRWKTEHRS
jgi:hypothetical protein